MSECVDRWDLKGLGLGGEGLYSRDEPSTGRRLEAGGGGGCEAGGPRFGKSLPLFLLRQRPEGGGRWG